MEDTRSLSQVIAFTVIDVITTVLSLIGNSLVCLAFYRNRRLRRIVTNIYVLSLVIADMTAAMFVFPFFTVASGLRRWPFNDIFSVSSLAFLCITGPKCRLAFSHLRRQTDIFASSNHTGTLFTFLKRKLLYPFFWRLDHSVSILLLL